MIGALQLPPATGSPSRRRCSSSRREGRLLAANSDEIAAADLAFDVEAQRLEETLHRDVERRFPPRRLFSLRSLIQHECLRTPRLAPQPDSRLACNLVADAVSASLTRPREG